MPSLSYSTTINGKTHQVDIDEIHGAGAGTWHVLIDRFYQGAIVIKEGKLEFLPGVGCKLQGEEIAGLLDSLVVLIRDSPMGKGMAYKKESPLFKSPPTPWRILHRS